MDVSPTGGGLEEEDPTVLHALARELQEETGLTLRHVVELVEQRALHGKNAVWMKYEFIVEVEEGEDQVKTNPREHDQWGWFTREEAADLKSPGGSQRRIIDEAFDRVEIGAVNEG